MPSPRSGFYFVNFLSSAFTFVSSYFYPTSKTAPDETLDKSAEETVSSPKHKEAKKRYDLSFISTLKLFDEVWFIDTSKRTSKEYIQLRRRLEEERIVVGQRYFLTENENLNEVVPAVLEKLSRENPNKLNKYFLVTAQTEIQLSPEICPITLQPEQDDTSYLKTIEAYATLDIEREYQSIRASLSTLANQYDAVKNTIEDLDKYFSERKLSLEYLKESLKQLRKKSPTYEENTSLESPSLSNIMFFSKLSPRKSQLRQAIKQIDAHIDEWVDSYQM
ncbi:hypothetical protein [Legionella brunensis]|uniref:Uncharacterized protein n=1 Tax=Legionella brunensis TaxID=29422 RepID=A0A0W0STV5_9GAMM|nr:hypothetical protein [Legionella brunensis]KTC86823.1 hypothetical protein Lbru_0764 [Legionella brunensis]